MTTAPAGIPEQVLLAWPKFAQLIWHPVTSGLINKTFRLENPQGITIAIVQRLHVIFEGTVNLDIDAVTRHLENKGMNTPRLIPTDKGKLWIEAEGAVWRSLTFIPGLTFEKVIDQQMAFEAGKLAGRFHRGLEDFEYAYRSPFRDVHNTAVHLNVLKKALIQHDSHPLYGEVTHAAGLLFLATERLPNLHNLPSRHGHGDLKISNLRFNQQRQGYCLIDLDTLGQMRWPFEMGDALRSWCNPNKEDEGDTSLNLDLFDGALGGYASVDVSVTGQERETLVDGLIQICLELSARFLSDTLNESYFAWDPTRYPSHGAHNLSRAQAMWNLHKSVKKQRLEAERIINTHFG